MSRIGKQPVALPVGVILTQDHQTITVKGAGGLLTIGQNPAVRLLIEDGKVVFGAANDSPDADALCGTIRQLVHNMVLGVTRGFEKKLSLVGVGYKAQAVANSLDLTVGYSHSVKIDMPKGITITTPVPTEIVIKGADRQRVGQIAAEIRAVRSPEPYKGKGIRYFDEKIIIKEAKKK